MLRNLLLTFTCFSALMIFGIVGYSYIEGWTLAESLYMTMITITTTGYQEVHPMSVEGRMFTIVLLGAGVCTLAFLTNLIVNEFMSMDRQAMRRQKMKKKIQSMKDHIIVCGFGRMGKNICKELEEAGVDFVVVDKITENFENVPSHYLWILGDATSDQMLIDAGVERASVLASMVDNDADSLYLTLAANSLNPELKIISRVSNDSAKVKLMRAGADEVVQPLLLSSRKVARMVLGDKASELDENQNPKEMKAKKHVIEEGSDWVDKSILEIEDFLNAKVMAVVSASGEVFERDEFFRTFAAGDTVILAQANRVKKAQLKLVS